MKKILFLMLSLILLGGANSVKADDKTTLDQLEAAYGATSAWVSSVPSSYPLNVLDAVLFGSDADSQTTNANVNNYDYIYFEVTDFSSARAVRVFFWDPIQNKRINYFLKPVAEKETADYGAQTTVSEAGTYCVKIPDGARLQGAKTPWIETGATTPYFKFSEIYLTERETPYVELEPYKLIWTPNAGTYRATIPLSESYIRTTGNVSINYSTGEVTNTGSGTLVIYLDNENLVGATGYNLTTTVEGEAGKLGASLDITDAVNGEVGGIYSSRNSWYIAGDGSRKDKIGAVKAFTYNFSGGAGSQTITSIYFDADLLVAQTATKDLTSMPYGLWTAPASTIGTYVSDDGGKTNNIGNGAQSLIYGHDGVGDVSKYVDLTNCSKIIFTGSSTDGGLRLFYNWDGTEPGKLTASIIDFPTTSGTYEFDIDAFKKANGITFFHLFGIKSSKWDTKANISAIQVVEYTNVISGSGVDKTKSYLENPYITSIDATGVTAATALSAANPNCLISANAGKITNANNVIVSGTCASLVLTDGANNFNAPADFTAASVSYDRTFTVDQKSTVCLPFALTADEVTEAGIFYELTDYSAGTLTFTEVDETEAYKPYLFKAAKANPFTSYSDKAVDETPANLSVIAGDATMTGTLAKQSVNGKYGWNSVGGAFSKATSDEVTIDAFRAYISLSGVSTARVAARFVESSVTGINEVSETQNVLNPDRKYIENGKIVIVKNGVKYNAAGAQVK